MIAPLRDCSLDHCTEGVHEKFLALLPRIQRQAAFAFRGLRAETRNEMTEEVVANAYSRFCPAGAPRQSCLGVFDPFGTVCDPSGSGRAARRRASECA